MARITDKEMKESIFRPKADNLGKARPKDGRYTLRGWEQRLDRNKTPVAGPKDKWLARTYKSGPGWQDYEIAANKDGSLFNPLLGPQHNGRDYVAVNDRTFDCYLNFLRSADPKFIDVAELQRMGKR